MKAIGKQRTYRERSQLKSREKLGQLEKKKDYVLRARNYHFKEKRINALREKARFKNPDEFYHAMINAKSSGGVHLMDRDAKMDPEILKLLQTQDANYIKYQQSLNSKKLERLENNLHIRDDVKERKHTIFVDDEEEAEKYDPTSRTEPVDEELDEFISQPFGGSKRSEESEGDSETEDNKPRLLDKNDLKKMKKERDALYREIQDRKQRAEKLQSLDREITLRRNLMKKGPRVKIGTDDKGLAVYKWKSVRKK
ncbi:UTP11-like, U3 small nucleolar ribonucleoprotein [Nowakowskiella sp. JEL0407]|nr:UTP11-like, U3 small nucleolar ribonucleoprotein [Nowakowskiella sp. JEL0407]